MSPRAARVVPFGDAALLVELDGGIDLEANRRAHAVAAAIRGDLPGRWGRPVPAYDTVLVTFDPLLTDGDAAAERLTTLVAAVPDAAADPRTEGPAIEIPVHYGGADGPDLDEVAERLGLSPAQVIEAHASAVYRALFFGFAPGFVYLGPLPQELAVPRRPSPRTRVPAGSVAIAGLQTGVYPSAMPGGWNLIGRTGLAVWEAQRDPPALLRPGASVRFVPQRA